MTKKWLHRDTYSYRYRYEISTQEAGQSLIDLMTHRFSFRSQEYWLELNEKGLISVNGQGQDPGYILQENDVLHTERPDVSEPDVNADIQFIYDKEGLLIVNKPAPLPVHPSGRFYKNSLTYILKEQYDFETLHTLHRLDHFTTGVLCLATDSKVARQMHMQFEKKSVRKVYAVLVQGHLGREPFKVDQPIGRVDGVLRGCGLDVTGAKESLTHFLPIASAGDYQLLLAEPVTGRTNQIRVHATFAGAPVWNDPLYGEGQADEVTEIGLHCLAMKFKHEFLDAGQHEFMAAIPDHFQTYFSKSELSRLENEFTKMWSLEL